MMYGDPFYLQLVRILRHDVGKRYSVPGGQTLVAGGPLLH